MNSNSSRLRNISDSEGCLEKIVVFLLMSCLMVLGSALCSGELNPVLEPASVQPGISIPEQGWLQWILWVFRVPGMVIALAVVPLLWLRVLVGQRFRVSSSDPPITQPPSDLPAATVSVLEAREATPRTLLTSILEMCQRGTLQISGVRGECDGREGSDGEGKYVYRLVPTDDPAWEWESTLCTVIPGGNVTVGELSRRLELKSSVIGEQLGEFLRHRGLFDKNPITARKLVWTERMEWLSATLMAIGFVAWAVVLGGAWWAKIPLIMVLGAVYWIAWAMARTKLERLSKAPPSDAGVDEIGRWMRLKRHLRSLTRANDSDRTDQLLPYAIALNATEPWLNDELDAPPWFGVTGVASVGELTRDRREAYHGFMSAEMWGLSGRSKRASGWAVPLDGGAGGGGDGDGGADF